MAVSLFKLFLFQNSSKKQTFNLYGLSRRNVFLRLAPPPTVVSSLNSPSHFSVCPAIPRRTFSSSDLQRRTQKDRAESWGAVKRRDNAGLSFGARTGGWGPSYHFPLPLPRTEQHTHVEVITLILLREGACNLSGCGRTRCEHQGGHGEQQPRT